MYHADLDRLGPLRRGEAHAGPAEGRAASATPQCLICDLLIGHPAYPQL
jgi:hypothetical protein